MIKKILINILKLIFLIAVFWFVGKSISANFDKIKGIDFKHFDPKYIFFSIIAMFISMLYPVFVWKYLIHALGEKINTLSALKIWFISNLGRYIPGKILQFAGLVYLASKEGIERGKAIQSVLYSQITANGLGLLMGLALLVIKSSTVDFPNPFHLTLILIAVFILVLWMPAIFLRSSNYVLIKLKKDKIEQTLSKNKYLTYLLMQIINWMLMSLSFILLINSYTSLSLSSHPEVIFILPLSWTIGLIALFAPGGIGVREGVMTLWLSNFIPIEFAVVLPWIYRLIITLVEIILTLIFAVSYKKPEIFNKLKKY